MVTKEDIWDSLSREETFSLIAYIAFSAFDHKIEGKDSIADVEGEICYDLMRLSVKKYGKDPKILVPLDNMMRGLKSIMSSPVDDPGGIAAVAFVKSFFLDYLPETAEGGK